MKRWAQICALLLSAGMAQTAQAQTYDQLMRKANAASELRSYDQAIALYKKAFTQLECRRRSGLTDIKQLKTTDACWRVSVVLFNIAQTQKRMGKPAETLAAFRTYLRHWRNNLPAVKSIPLEERVTFETAESQLQLKRYQDALVNYRTALTLWRARKPNKRARFTDVALRKIAVCLERLQRRKQAMAAYRRFLDQYKQANGRPYPDAEEIEARIVDLSKALLRADAERAKQKAAEQNRHAAQRDAARLKEQELQLRQRRAKRWLIATITTATLAAAAEGLALGFYFKGKDKFEKDPSLTSDRTVLITGHVVAATMLTASVVSLVMYLRGRPSRETTVQASVAPIRSGVALSVGGKF